MASEQLNSQNFLVDGFLNHVEGSPTVPDKGFGGNHFRISHIGTSGQGHRPACPVAIAGHRGKKDITRDRQASDL